MQLTGGEIIARFLSNMGVPYVAGIPGHGCLPLTDALFKQQSKISPILPRQEMSGVHLADGYFRTTGKPLAVFTSIGPGAINTAIGVATCYVDSTPVMVFTGDVHTHMFGKGVLQEIERRHDSAFSKVMEPITKRTWQVASTTQLPGVLKRAWLTMMGGRKGPVVISLPMDVQAASIDVDPKALRVETPKLLLTPNPVEVDKAVALMKNAKRPMILAGGGVLYGDATDELLQVAELWSAPTMTTLAGKSAFPETHPLSAWLGGSKGTAIGNALAPKADVILAVGARFADETASSYREGITYSEATKIIHVDIDPKELGKNYPAAVGIVGDAKTTLAALSEGLSEAGFTAKFDKGEYYKEVQKVKREWFSHLRKTAWKKRSPISISGLLKVVRETLPEEAIVVTSSGNTQAQLLQEFPFSVPGTCLTTGGFSTMGWALPAAMGAKLAHPEKPVVAIVGDGDFMMTMQELSCALQHNIPVIAIVANNSGWIAIKDLQMAAFGEERGYMTDFVDGNGKLSTPDFAKVAKAFGCWSRQVKKPDEVARAIKAAMNQESPAVIEVIVNRTYPVSGGEATGWWDVPIPTYLKAKRKKYEKEKAEEKL
jgi:acetolactate synthase I/II/III large subunit